MPTKRKLVQRDSPSPEFVAFGQDSWYIKWADGGWNSEGLGEELLWELTHTRKELAFLALGSDDGRWFVKFKDGTSLWFGLAKKLARTLQKWPAVYVQLLDNDGYFVKFEEGTTEFSGLPTKLHQLSSKYGVDRMYSNGSDGWLTTFAPDGQWEFAGLPISLAERIPSKLHQNNIKFLALSPDGSSYFAHINNRWWWSAPSAGFELLMDPAPTSMDPSEIYFSSNSISQWFQDGNSVFDTIYALKYGSLDATDFPTIRIVWHKQGWWSLDNRRLFCFKEASLDNVPVQAVEAEEFVVSGKGDTVSVRG